MRPLLSIIGTVIVLSVPRAERSGGSGVSPGSGKSWEFTGGSDLASAAQDPNQTEPDGTTPLHWAVQQDRLDIVQALISARREREREEPLRRYSAGAGGYHRECIRHGSVAQGGSGRESERAGDGKRLDRGCAHRQPGSNQITSGRGRGCELRGTL